MVDKVWYDWQHANPEKSFWAYHGGSVQNQSSLAIAKEYPNGQPPWLSVRFYICLQSRFNGSTHLGYLHSSTHLSRRTACSLR